MKILDTVEVGLGNRSYAIHIGAGLLGGAKKLLPFDPAGKKLFILTDENAAPHAKTLGAGLEKAGGGKIFYLTIAPGEASKSWKEAGRVLSWLLDGGADRQSVLFACGGGVVGDLGGFAASVALRGIPYVQVPTTLLAMVDSAVGGKTGVDMPQGKNLAGSFYQPSCVLCDPDTLKTLPAREMRAGYAEIVKYGLIDDPEFFIWLEGNGGKVIGGDPAALAYAVAASCRKKAAIVAADEREKPGGPRALLNLGHTFGHALEAAAGYDGRLLHGEAVAIGMALAFQLSFRTGHCREEDADRVAAHLEAAGLPARIDRVSPRLDTDVGRIVSHMKHDKKARNGKITFILARGIGKAFACDTVDMKDVREVLLHSMGGGA